MSSDGSASHWLGQFKEGDRGVLQALWQRYFPRLVGLARLHLQNTSRVAVDEEDVALSAFASFCQGVEKNRFPQLEDRDDLWNVLVVLTVRKAGKLRRYEGQQKRGGAVEIEGGDSLDLKEILSREPTPAFAAEIADECRRLLACLVDRHLDDVARGKLEGYTNAEIAERLGCSPRTIERKLDLIRDLWQAERTS